VTLCEQCGSIQIERTPPGITDRLVAIFTGKRPFLCFRCGWRGRRNWTDDDLKALLEYGAGGAEPDPALAVLDDEKPSRERRRRQTRRKGKKKASVKAPPDAFDLDPLSLTGSEIGTSDEEEKTAPVAASRQRRGIRRTPSLRREIVMAIAVTLIVMLFVFVLSISPGCGAAEVF
jgi:hypothetical protein